MACTRCWDDEMLQKAMTLLLEEFPLASDVPGGMPEYRRSLIVSFFFKFYWTVRAQMPGLVQIIEYENVVIIEQVSW